MKNKLLTGLFGVFISLLFISVLYNLLPSQPFVRFSLLILFYCFVPLLIIKFGKVSLWYILLALILPSTIIDISTLVTNPSLIPLRFPISTAYPIFGGIMSLMILKRHRYRWVMLCICVAAVFLIQYFYPILIYNRFKKSTFEVVLKKDIHQLTFITVDGGAVKLADTIKTKVHLLEFFFAQCLPCHQKIPTLKRVVKNFTENTFSVIHICDGELTKYDQFLTYAKKNNYPGFIFLYAQDSTLRKVFGRELVFPSEQLIYSGNEFISTEMGYSPEIEKIYYDNKIKVINKYVQK